MACWTVFHPVASSAREFSPTAEGIARARSSSEAFLFRRLETLDATRGKFRLNAKLPIPFDQRGEMEVDLLWEGRTETDCTDRADWMPTPLVIELDGDQHLADRAAYRRDRRKDALLQENGYFILRVLTADIGKDLDTTLDTIIRTMEHLSQQ